MGDIYRRMREDAIGPLREMQEQLDALRRSGETFELLRAQDALQTFVEEEKRRRELMGSEFQQAIERSRSAADELADYAKRAREQYGLQKAEWQALLGRLDSARDEMFDRAEVLKRFALPSEELAAIAAHTKELYAPLLDLSSAGYVFSSMAAIRQAVDISPYSDLTAAALRTQLGDWRQVVVADDSSEKERRQELYREVGVDPHIQEVDGETLQVIVEITQGESEPPPLAADYAPAVELELPADEESQQAAEDYVRLFQLETQLRLLIDRVMTAAVGPDWIVQRVPLATRERWEARRREAVDAKGRDDVGSLLAYSDLGDLPQIICQRNNWPHFEPYFGSKESIQESFNRLAPLRRDIGHCRPLTPVDNAYFRVEVHRLWVAVQRPPRRGDDTKH